MRAGKRAVRAWYEFCMRFRPAAVLLGALLLGGILALGPLRPLLSHAAHAVGLRRTPVAATPGAPLPPLALTDLNGTPAALEEKGTVVYNVFTSWCPSCNQELPDILSAYGALQKRGVRFVGIDQGESPDRVAAFISARSIPYPVLLDSSRATTVLLGARMIPETVIVHDGTVKRIIVGPTTNAQLTEAVEHV